MYNLWIYWWKIYKKAHFDSLIQKRQRKGGQSALRISRLAEETRYNYVIKIIDKLNALNRKNKMILFGSKEICSQILNSSQCLVTICDGGFLDINSRTINNTSFFIEK